LLARTCCGNLEIFFGVKILEIWQIGAIFFLKNPFYVSFFQVKEEVKFVATTQKKKETPLELCGCVF
jgi:hypothetical protein